MALNGLHPKLDSRRNHIVDNHMRRALELDVYQKLGISFTELMNMPRGEIIRIYEICDDFIGSKAAIEENLRKKEEARKKSEDESRNRVEKRNKGKDWGS